MFSTLKSPSAFTVFHRTAVFSDRVGVKLETAADAIICRNVRNPMMTEPKMDQ